MKSAFALDLAHGACVGVSLPEAVDDALLDALLVGDERAFAATLAPHRRIAWIGGRAALRAAASRAGLDLGAVLATDRGAPALPPHVSGSISHKKSIAVALAAAADGAARGVDVEIVASRRVDVASRILRDEELDAVASLDPDARSFAVLLSFSIKESLYKALDRFVARYVGFKEVSVAPHDDGTVDVAIHLPERGFDAEAFWLRRDDCIVTTARVRRR